ncbi:DUF4198 domain-containing protein [Luteibacter sp. NPDC031894]|uniref:DUF4198 domain-containing protein n=1 Tax=Luteibacter sp. NPDC031894 TaxID=3390572 RepID=UPI003D03F81F
MRRLLASLVFASAGAAMAHDFWVEPAAFRTSVGGTTPFTLQVGHGPYRQRSPIPANRITRFDLIGPSVTTDVRTMLRPGGKTDDGNIALPGSGTYVVVLETDNRAESHLPSLRFNDYLTVEGLTPALERRQREHRMDYDETEIYSRRAKVIMQAGAFDATAQASVTQPLGLALEIVPEVNPYALPRPTILPVHVVYRGRPLAGATVKLTDLDHDERPVELHITDDTGRATFALPVKGRWLLNVIWTRVLPPNAEADYETDFSSLSFGFS